MTMEREKVQRFLVKEILGEELIAEPSTFSIRSGGKCYELHLLSMSPFSLAKLSSFLNRTWKGIGVIIIY